MLVGCVDRIGPASHLNYEERLAPIWFAGVRVVHCNERLRKTRGIDRFESVGIQNALGSGRSIGLDPTTRAEIGSSGAKLQRPKAPISIRPSSVHGRTWVWTYRVAWLQRLHVMNMSPTKAAANLLVNHP